ncbi:AraC family transcriptional regulator (plasmid) [Martelella lutilitoris]|uniref:AraC family transcriptional regulator n=1 Tax=Martelella lutilitoris TaxID=2583532 RepID=A0A7T7HPF2_9HYPH|nr:AraC family transcriptional regulator [Martelella lutilitoris]QRX65028.1 AraC family transcriptional regulator [Dysgonomonadaceae bacterium zrk40]
MRALPCQLDFFATEPLKEGFRLTIGKSIHAYLRTTRIEAAADLISAGASVTEAALAVGFENLSHFSKAFRAEKGVLPSRYGAV